MYQKKYPEITSKIELDFCKVNYQLIKLVGYKTALWEKNSSLLHSGQTEVR